MEFEDCQARRPFRAHSLGLLIMSEEQLKRKSTKRVHGQQPSRAGMALTVESSEPRNPISAHASAGHSLTLSPRLECSGVTSQALPFAQAGLKLLASTDPPISTSQSAGITAGTTGTHHQSQLTFIFLVETGFHHVGQAGLKLLTSGDPPAWASQSAGITGHFGRPRRADHLRSGVQDQPGQRGKNLSLLTIQKLAGHGGKRL
ncbi:hypothetical protein AAY473_025264 [Plecturocebus cupreus]